MVPNIYPLRENLIGVVVPNLHLGKYSWDRLSDLPKVTALLRSRDKI